MIDQKTQTAGDNSTNLQAGEITLVQQGLSYSEVKQAALDVFNSNFYKLAGKASEVARNRAEQITEAFLHKLKIENPAGLTNAEDPDFQYSLYTIQKEHARIGDDGLADLLVDLLVDRSKRPTRDIQQIVLNESLKVAPKLTKDQLAALSMIFLFKYTRNHGIGNHDALGKYFDKHVEPIIKDLSCEITCYQHLEFTGCGSVLVGNDLEELLGKTYQGLFLKGFEVNEVEKRNISIGSDERFFIPCLNDHSKIQIRTNNEDTLKKRLEKENIAKEDAAAITSLFNMGKMSKMEIREKCIAIRPFMSDLFDVWNNSDMKITNLTSVGIAIGHANIKRSSREFTDLSIWLK